MTVGLTVCPECGSDTDTVESAESEPLQSLRQSCPACDWTTVIGIVNYHTTYTVVGDAVDGDTCSASTPTDSGLAVDRCGESATMRYQQVGDPPNGLCEAHTLALYDRARSLL